jgi:serine/threonine protein kinase
VNLCLYRPLNREVAVKHLKRGPELGEAQIESLKLEIALLKKLQHPNIIECVIRSSLIRAAKPAGS